MKQSTAEKKIEDSKQKDTVKICKSTAFSDQQAKKRTTQHLMKNAVNAFTF